MGAAAMAMLYRLHGVLVFLPSDQCAPCFEGPVIQHNLSGRTLKFTEGAARPRTVAVFRIRPAAVLLALELGNRAPHMSLRLFACLLAVHVTSRKWIKWSIRVAVV